MRAKFVVILVGVALLVGACDNGGGEEENGNSEDLAYYCGVYARHWCPAFLSCDEALFAQSFHTYAECVELTERDCLEPPPGFEPCRGVTQEEADACADYLDDNMTDHCELLFGRTADMAPCEEDLCN